MAVGDYLYSMRGLMGIIRYQNKKRINSRTIAEHKWSASKIAQALALWHFELTGVKVDMGSLLEKSILNGTIKLFSGEIQSDTKYANKNMLKAVTEAEELIYEEKYKEMLPVSWRSSFKEKVLYSKDGSLEGEIIRASNIIDTILECIEEIEFGNKRKFTTILNEEIEKLLEIDLEIIKWFIKYSLPNIASLDMKDIITVDIEIDELENEQNKEKIAEFKKTFAIYIYEIRGMMEIKRYQNAYRNKERTVAEHEWFVSLIALCLSKIEKEKYGNNVNLGSLLQTTLSHDDIELFSGDVLSHTKRTTSNLLIALEEVESELFEEQYKEMIPVKWVDRFRKDILFPKDDTLEGKIMSSADVIDTVYEAIEEIKLGNKEEFKPILKNSVEKLLSMDLESVDYFLLNSLSGFGFDIKDYCGVEVYNYVRNLQNIYQ